MIFMNATFLEEMPLQTTDKQIYSEPARQIKPSASIPEWVWWCHLQQMRSETSQTLHIH